MEPKQIQSILESMLFLWGEPLSVQKMASVLEISKTEVRKNLEQMALQYEVHNRGISLIEVDKHYQLTTNKANHIWIERLCSRSKSKGLSHSSLEVLAIVAYKQPVTRSQIEDIRGVKCDSPLHHLLDRELIEEKGRLEQIGKPIVYGTTKMFLSSFGFSSLSDLPSIEDFENVEFLFRKNPLESPDVLLKTKEEGHGRL